MDKKQTAFSWDKQLEDPNIAENGKILIWVHGGPAAVQRFAEELSRRIGHKCDWAYAGGKAHIGVLPDGLSAARAAITDMEWMEQFIVPYTGESAENGTYFDILGYVNPPCQQ